MKAIIALEDGTVFHGHSFTGSGEASGEIVFNTGMTGYQELITDPSYKGQIVTMTYPLIGNYGINAEDVESGAIQVEAFVMREYEDDYSNWRATATLKDYLLKNRILGIDQVDTRAITRHIRLAGAMKAYLSTDKTNIETLVRKARQIPSLSDRNLVKQVSCPAPYVWSDPDQPGEAGFKVAVLDCGLKINQLRLLSKRGCKCHVFPCWTTADEILASNPDGFFISNGPGDPAILTDIVETVTKLLDKLPIFGICLGHQILGQAFGGKTYKLKFGHRGENQPVKNLETGKVEITSQNHGYAVDPESLPPEVKITHINLNDNTVEGMRHLNLPVFSVQHHPENAPGPHDSEYLFDLFIEAMKKN